ncbi:MAG: hypothetical protein K2W95_36570 [Candidatus Obscuribacterales bacterium]|nr:hypothetical protein [Candidatus Obscuribacterales bacterium]
MTVWSPEDDAAYLKWKEEAESAEAELGEAYTEQVRTETALEAARLDARLALNSLSVSADMDRSVAKTAIGGYIRARLCLFACGKRVTAASGNLLRIMNSLPEGDAPVAD